MERTTVQAVIDARLGTFAETAQPMGWFIMPPRGVKTSLADRDLEKLALEMLKDEGGIEDG